MNVSFYSMFLFGNLVYTFWKADKVLENVQAPSFICVCKLKNIRLNSNFYDKAYIYIYICMSLIMFLLCFAYLIILCRCFPLSLVGSSSALLVALIRLSCHKKEMNKPGSSILYMVSFYCTLYGIGCWT